MSPRRVSPAPVEPSTESLLELSGITRRYGNVVACNDVSLSVPAGQVRGLLGQNGAGKSTLMRIVCGIERPDAGEVRVDGSALRAGDPLAASAAGIGMVHQHFSLVPRLTVWENVILGERGPVDRSEVIDRITEIAGRFHLEVDPTARVEQLSPGQRQRVEIIKCLRRDPRIIILDEPTSVLTQSESQALFEVLKALVQDGGRALILISHRLQEILTATDLVTTLRGGMVTSTVETAKTSARELASEMVGREVSLGKEAAALGVGAPDERWGEAERASTTPSVPALRVEDVVVRGAHHQELLSGLTLEVRRGEIVGVAGVEGNGQGALVDLLSNLHSLERGRVELNGKPVKVGHRRALEGVAVIPADRHDSGCVLQMTIAENLALGRTREITRHGFVSRRRLHDQARRLVRDFDVVTPSVDLPMRSLSGGNQQRLVLARELAGEPKVLVASQPTHGLDVGAMEYMWDRFREVARGGTAVLLVSTELDEILALADRILVINRGAIVGEMPGSRVDMEQLGMMMGGHAA